MTNCTQPASKRARLWSALLAALLAWAEPVRADQPVPANILEPQTAREAWNIIRLATQNVERLIEEKRPTEILVQISYCSPSLRLLARQANGPEAQDQIALENKSAFNWIISIAHAAKGNDLETIRGGLAQFRIHLERIARHFEAPVVAADIFACPMHPEVISEKGQTPCAKCGTGLLSRRIPYSFIYATPGEPTIRLQASPSGPVEAGRKIDVKLRLEKADRSAVLTNDLLATHTERLHLLIEEPGLGDYHHEHPAPTQTPGEYVFSFTPKKTAPYRIWADLVPMSSGVQEMPFVDLPSSGKAATITSSENHLNSTVEGYQFVLSFPRTEKLPVTARQTRLVSITVTDPTGKPVTNLEPVMNAFAHLVGFYSDYQTVVHLHPRGGDILNPDFRGGPTLGFNFFPPKNGLVRLYCQVKIGGKALFAPFSLNVEPYCAPPITR